MNVFWRKILLLLFLPSFIMWPLLAQDEEEDGSEAERSNWVIEDRPFSYQNIQVPRETWATIKTMLANAGHSDKAIENIGIIPVSIKVEISTDDFLVLKNASNYQINFVEGGGGIDLFKYVVSKGAFHIRMVPDMDFSKKFHVLYLSDSPGKKTERVSLGNACGRMYDLTKVKDRFVMDRGMLVTGARKQYLHLMAGTFIFFQLIEERFYLGYIRLEDTRYPQFKCGEKV